MIPGPADIQYSLMNMFRKYIPWIAGVAVAGMILWLITSAAILHRADTGNPGSLFGKPVTLHQYMHALEAVTHDALLRYGDQYRRQLSEDQLQDQAWERLILTAEARRQKIKITNTEVVAEIQRYPLFQRPDGQFDQAGYQTVIQYSLGTNPRAFEEEVREDLMIRKLLEKSIGNPTLTEDEVREGFQRREEQLRLRFLIVPTESLAKEISDAARKDPAQFDAAAADHKLPIKKSDLFKRNETVPDLGPVGANLEPALRLEPGEVSPALPTAKGWVVAQLLERQKADESKLAASRGQLEKELLDRKRLKAYLSWYQDLIKRASPRKSL